MRIPIQILVSYLIICLVSSVSTVFAADDAQVKIGWDLTTTQGEDCSGTEPLVGSVTYRVMYKVFGMDWLSEVVETPAPPVILTGLKHYTTYSVRVGAFKEGGQVQCWSEESQFTTGGDSDFAPNAPTNLTIVQ